jgi:hypothetical protein
MVSPNVTRILNEAEALTDAEREQLRDLLEERAARKAQLTTQTQVRQVLLDEGILSHVPAQGKDPERFRRWQPVAIKGKPLSQTIIEERR